MLSEVRLNLLKNFVLFMCQKVYFGPQNIVWGLNFGGQWPPWIRHCDYKTKLITKARNIYLNTLSNFKIITFYFIITYCLLK